MLNKLSLRTSQRVEFIDITKNVTEVIKKNKFSDGVCNIFIPHTTAGITINENADPSVVKDIINTMNNLIPFDGNYSHIEGNSAAHIKSSIFGHSLAIPVEDTRLLLGTWQGIFFCEFDGPRTRNFIIKLI
ncbi:MAG: YjbQ family protein [Candidatus Firestonebacteria bacterium]|nr:YjbQ family protein [Candidatus Firestonebacteria bacterium]